MPTYKTFYALLDNYERSTGTAETVTHEEKQENWAFLNAIMQTDCMKYVHKYLVRKNLASQSEKGFKSELYKLWFNLYRRESYNDSSGFEHVFVGEEKNGKVFFFLFLFFFFLFLFVCFFFVFVHIYFFSQRSQGSTTGSNSSSKKSKATSTTEVIFSPEGEEEGRISQMEMSTFSLSSFHGEMRGKISQLLSWESLLSLKLLSIP